MGDLAMHTAGGGQIFRANVRLLRLPVYSLIFPTGPPPQVVEACPMSQLIRIGHIEATFQEQQCLLDLNCCVSNK